MSVLKLEIFVDVEFPVELAQSKFFLAVLVLLNFVIWASHSRAILQGDNVGYRTDTSS